MRLRPLHDWVLIKRMEPDERTAGGIIIPSSAKEKPSEGIVQAMGPGRYKTEKGKKEKKFIPTVLKPGERVFFVDYKARDIDFDGEDITLIREDDILGIYESAGPAERRSPWAETKEGLSPAAHDKAGAQVKKSPEKKVLSVPGTKPKKAKPKKTVAVRRPTKAGKKVVKKVAKSTAGKKPVPKKSKKTIIPKPPKKILAKKEKAKRTTAATKASKKVAAKTVAKKILSKKVAPKKAVVKKTVSRSTGVKKTAAKSVKKTVSKGKKGAGKH